MYSHRIQDISYWTEELEITSEDVEHLYGLLLESERPLAADELALALVTHRVQQEETRLRSDIASGELYQPKDHYDAGQRLIFPTFDFHAGTVVNVRPGHNPEHGDFEVITVMIDGEASQKEFAASLQTPHKLNQENGQGGLEQVLQTALNPQELYDTVAAGAQHQLVSVLSQSSVADFIESDDQWLLKDTLADIHVGHLNIAEALIEMGGEPVSPAELMQEMELPEEVPADIRAFSLRWALRNDDRFDQVTVGDEPQWFLRRLEPDEAFEVPVWLRHEPVTVDSPPLPPETVQLEWELDDEWSEDSSDMDEVILSTAGSTWMVTYPHLRAGTLPLSPRLQELFPHRGSGRSMITLIDQRQGRRFTGWIIPEGRYVAGLETWYKENHLVVGGYMVLGRMENEGEVLIDFRPRRRRREWARVLRVEEGRPILETSKVEIACEYDELLVVNDADPKETDVLRARLVEEGTSLEDLVDILMPEITKLSSQGTAHVKTLYSVLNMLRRVPPAPILTVLASSPSFEPVGDGYWRLAGR